MVYDFPVSDLLIGDVFLISGYALSRIIYDKLKATPFSFDYTIKVPWSGMIDISIGYFVAVCIFKGWAVHV